MNELKKMIRDKKKKQLEEAYKRIREEETVELEKKGKIRTVKLILIITINFTNHHNEPLQVFIKNKTILDLRDTYFKVTNKTKYSYHEEIFFYEDVKSIMIEAKNF
jgi:hypothetical protein